MTAAQVRSDERALDDALHRLRMRTRQEALLDDLRDGLSTSDAMHVHRVTYKTVMAARAAIRKVDRLGELGSRIPTGAVSR